jgi:hypothetical protein
MVEPVGTNREVSAPGCALPAPAAARQVWWCLLVWCCAMQHIPFASSMQCGAGHCSALVVTPAHWAAAQLLGHNVFGYS